MAMGFVPGTRAVSAVEQGKINHDKEGDEYEKLDQDSHEPASNLAPAPSQVGENSTPYSIPISKSASSFRALRADSIMVLGRRRPPPADVVAK